MARIGEGDQRWIVKDRDDGANCNNWHWTEKNITGWAHDRFKEIVEKRAYDLSPAAHAAATKVTVTEMTGDCGLMNRKKKLVYYYQVTFKLGWTCEIDGEKATGALSVTDVDQDEDEDDFDYAFTVTGSVKPACHDGVVHVKKHGLRYVATVLSEFKEIIKEFMNSGGSLGSPTATGRAAEQDDDFADVDDDAIPSEVSFPAPAASAQRPKLTGRPVPVTIVKSALTDPMGVVLDPDTLELLDVRESTAGYTSAARHCLGLHLVSINGSDVASMDNVLGLAKAHTTLHLMFADRELRAGRHEASVVLNDRLLDDAKALQGEVPLADSIKSVLLSNRAWGRIMKNKDGYKSNIVTNAAWEDAKLACACAGTPEALMVKGWVAYEAAKMSAAETDRQKYFKEAYGVVAELLGHVEASEHAVPLLECLLASVGSFQNFSSYVPLTLLKHDAAALVLGAKLHALLGSTPDATFLKLGYGRQLRKECRPHRLLQMQTLAKLVGAKIRPVVKAA